MSAMDPTSVAEYLLVASTVTSIFAGASGIGGGYNTALALFGIWVLFTASARAMYWFFVFLGVSFVADIILLAVVGNNAVQANTFANTTETNTMVFGVATTAINMFIKAALAYFCLLLFQFWGGSAAAAHPPTAQAADGSAGGMPPAGGDSYAGTPSGGYGVPSAAGGYGVPAATGGYGVPSGAGYAAEGNTVDSAHKGGVESYQSS
ncbi:hypothetical protein FNF27_03361 [Cafeteria roenbergensis]|uniref:Uncharacterized protein n=1 Tax=Cafeteria roenbergensis TaxID=33653 RepID=A0A5A8CX18_CAFRO|nr:hypothetical protein FNF29_05679 [Cafeteria roenbergensis]KAA0156977.1 hypothetical protein FNF31_05811 [Cafeteria roenbergensis]KAA0169228.1 hypothetical protein FNF28_02182 [Cafeteria roenbergensis]KAA0175063.1 hypothetical protein FNF27_03361 [Cafeteria roenbergensis]|eukprot:KAA0149854.1 hypothetical protein FNF29_05679 [Cafeteria roenbergensis]